MTYTEMTNIRKSIDKSYNLGKTKFNDTDWRGIYLPNAAILSASAVSLFEFGQEDWNRPPVSFLAVHASPPTTCLTVRYSLPAQSDRQLPSSPIAGYSLPVQPPPPLPIRLHQRSSLRSAS
ncbi:hypothetical protein L2E82_32899 [Cichorium intybus]|uniref:Uncharacterized protein n=1 Tax=Cichorium intybus TaxID=13427 RepID=A0ACB9BI11_CICIN|nr:hypothetical protein L2E82_32899 [Cichorium intybus]